MSERVSPSGAGDYLGLLAPPPQRSRAWLAVLAVLPALITAFAGWLSTQTAEAQGRQREARAWDEYGAYVTSQLYRDEALADALERCRWVERWAVAGRHPAEPMPLEQRQADAVLDQIARENGWRPEVIQ